MDCVHYYEEPIMGGRMRICNFGDEPVWDPNCKGCENAISQNDVLECWQKLKRGVLVEVVRCKDCKHSYQVTAYRTNDGKDVTMLECDIDGYTTASDWFCAEGERKDGGKDDGKK